MYKILFVLLLSLTYNLQAHAQSSKAKKKILVDINHGQRFYNDPSRMQGKDSAFVQRIRYMTGELDANAKELAAETQFINTPITKDLLKNSSLLFIHMPSAQFSKDEVVAITDYVKRWWLIIHCHGG